MSAFRQLTLLVLLVIAALALGTEAQAQDPIAFTSVGDNADLSTDPLASEGNERGELQAEPDVAVDPNDPDHVVALVQEGRLHADGGAQAIAFATSLDGGDSWTTGLLPGVTLATGGDFERATDPVAAIGPDGTAYALTLVFNLADYKQGFVISRSFDGGLTWKAPRTVFYIESSAHFLDKGWLTVDTNPASPRVGTLYAAWKDFTSSGADEPLFVQRSTDRGKSWNKKHRATKDGSAFAAQLGTLKSGKLVVGYAAFDQIRVVKSKDGGRTFTNPRTAAVMQPGAVDGLRSGERLPSMTIDPVDGTIHFVWQDDRDDVVDVLAIHSNDRGKTWTAPINLSDAAPGEAQFLPDVSAYGGHVHVFYYDGTDAEGAENDDAYTFTYSQSLDGGVSFLDAIPVADAPSLAADAASTTGGQMFGDYMGSAAAASVAYAVWVDTRDGQPDLYAAAVGP